MAKKTNKADAQTIAKAYMNAVLNNGSAPKSVHAFCKENGLEETDFFNAFGSFTYLEKKIWSMFYDHTLDNLHKSDIYESLTSKDKLLTFYFTFFEVLTANRSYILQRLEGQMKDLEQWSQLSLLRKSILTFAEGLIQDDNANKTFKINRRPEKIFSEATWIQTLFILKFWLKDGSPGFEKTDLVIEKSVRVVFDVFDSSTLDSLLDFGKFLWKEAAV